VTEAAIKRILIGLDGSANSAAALEFAIVCARQLGAEIVAVFAVPLPSSFEYSGHIAGAPLPAVPIQLDSDWRAGMVQEFEQVWCRKLRDADLPQQMVVEDGPAATVLAGMADKLSADLVVVGRTGKGEIAEVLLGSVSHELAQQCKRPVLLVSSPES
jgi:nucleotide-binding universal stress UspA family protein